MGSFSLPFDTGTKPAALFSDMPPSFRSYLHRGFEQLAQLDKSRIGSLAKLLAEGANITDEDALTEMCLGLNLDVADAGSLGAALTVLVAFVTGRNDLAEVITAGESIGAIPSTDIEKIRAIAKELETSKAALTEAVEFTSLASEVAPSFQRLSIATELRFGFDAGKISKTVPVAICFLATDSRSHSCVFQMKKGDVTQLITQLQRVESQLSSIEAWARERG